MLSQDFHEESQIPKESRISLANAILKLHANVSKYQYQELLLTIELVMKNDWALIFGASCPKKITRER